MSSFFARLTIIPWGWPIIYSVSTLFNLFNAQRHLFSVLKCGKTNDMMSNRYCRKKKCILLDVVVCQSALRFTTKSNLYTNKDTLVTGKWVCVSAFVLYSSDNSLRMVNALPSFDIVQFIWWPEAFIFCFKSGVSMVCEHKIAKRKCERERK